MLKSTFGLASILSTVICIEAIYIIYQSYSNARIREDLNHMNSKRNADRTGRIRAEKKLRENRKDEIQKSDGQHMKYIGYIETPFPDRRGTPRQPLLVPSAHGRIKFNKQIIQSDHFQELSQFSHVWITFVFHENTNADGGGRDKNATCAAKIAPPRLKGKKVGCLSTRSPHRPNPIGLSVCEIVSIGKDFIEIKSIDFVNGTPVLDVKPYIPYDVIALPTGTNASDYLPMAYDNDGNSLQVTSLRVPDWIRESDIPLRNVIFTTEAKTGLDLVICETGLQFCRDAIHAMNFITQVLRQDVRGVKQGRAVDLIDEKGQQYMCRLDSMEIHFSVKPENTIVESIIATAAIKNVANI
jgi:tRNA (adenine37-N6)-methyltransferase